MSKVHTPYSTATTSPLSKMQDSIPLLAEGDAFDIDLIVEEKLVTIKRILRYPNNENVLPVRERFFDLTPSTRRAVLAQINRRYDGRMVKAQ